MFCTDNIQIKLCDFGLSEKFDPKENPNFLSSKYCGKKTYKSPEIMNFKKNFNAKLNDIWCVGVCLFMMIFGGNPWSEAHSSDITFKQIMNGNIIKLINDWNKTEYITKELKELFELIFQYESNRANLNDIKNHSWLS